MLRSIFVCLLTVLAACDFETDPAGPDAPVGRTPVVPPNVLIFLTDDQRWDDTLPLSRIRQRIGEQGMTFSRAITTTSLCCPSRASILRGQYAHNHRVRHNRPPLGGWDVLQSLGTESSTLATWLAGAGYTTAWIGKYLNGYDDPSFVPPGWDEWVAMRPGYRHYEVMRNGVLEPVPDAAYSTSLVQRFGIDFIRSAPQPWMAMMVFYAPHLPSIPPGRYEDAFKDIAPLRPPSFNVPNEISATRRLSAERVAVLDRMRRQRLQTLLAVDEAVGAVLDSLEAWGQLDNTLIVFTSDNGYLLGEHALSAKNKPYEESYRVPMMIRGPGVTSGATSSALVANIDIAPTLADYAGAAIPSFVDGRSMRPLLEGGSAWRTALLIEHWTDEADNKGVVRANRTFVEWSTGQRELYDLSVDPYQLNNLAGLESASTLRPFLTALKSCSGQECRDADGGP
jgi:N-acetylglucosamine-6-sulfatase